MRITFLDHSGFLAELERVSLLFDWWKGDLPPLPANKPLYVFVSHRHQDHLDTRIFSLDGGGREVRFILGSDIRPRDLDRWGVPPETVARCQFPKGGQSRSLPRAEVEALPSTDEGAAFLVTAEGRTLFHAGDLNWWHWEGEDKAWNHNMAANFKRYTEPLRGRTIDLAMLPLDPRLGEAGFWGPKYFLELADIRKFLPMHQWGEFGFTWKFLEEYPRFADQTVPVERTGQSFAF